VSLRDAATFAAAMAASLLPVRSWPRLPASFPMAAAAGVSGIITLFAGAAVGIPGFLEHAHATTSLGLDAVVADMYRTSVYRGDLAIGFSGLSIFTFLLLTPKGWLTLYLMVGGTVRAMAAWFDDPIGDPAVTVIDALVAGRRARWRDYRARRDREALEGPEIPDRLVSSTAAGVPGCDLVIVSSRRKAGWDRGLVLITADACYRVGEPVERTVAGRLRTLYPLTEHRDLEVIRRQVRYELPPSSNLMAPERDSA
jgi:hypothetical protein